MYLCHGVEAIGIQGSGGDVGTQGVPKEKVRAAEAALTFGYLLSLSVRETLTRETACPEGFQVCGPAPASGFAGPRRPSEESRAPEAVCLRESV